MFSFETLREIFERQPAQQVGRNIVRFVSEDTKQYVLKYFFTTKDGNYYFLDEPKNELVCYNKEIISSVYINRFPLEVKIWFFKDNYKLHSIICDPKKGRVDGDDVNKFKGMMHKNDKPYSEYDKATKDKVEMMLQFVKDVLCNDNEVFFNYILKLKINLI